MAKKSFRNAVPACVLLIKSFRNGVPARSVTKIPLDRTIVTTTLHSSIHFSWCNLITLIHATPKKKVQLFQHKVATVKEYKLLTEFRLWWNRMFYSVNLMLYFKQVKYVWFLLLVCVIAVQIEALVWSVYSFNSCFKFSPIWISVN
jgi:hypothetical protein